MDTFVDSSWYWYRYLSPNNGETFFDRAQEAQWLPVSEYAGGIEHATMHLLYARFFAKALRDIGHVADGEPFRRLFNQGLVLGEDGEKMSKSRGNVVDPNSVLAEYGADMFRTFLMFLGPWSRGGPWSSASISGQARFFSRIWSLVVGGATLPTESPNEVLTRDLQRKLHQTMKKVGSDIERFNFNTAIAALMELLNALTAWKNSALYGTVHWQHAMRTFVLLLAPFAPHISEELWEILGQPYSVHRARWPTYDEQATREDLVPLIIQVNGKMRGRLMVAPGLSEEAASQLALASEFAQRALNGKPPKKVFFVQGRLVNVIV